MGNDNISLIHIPARLIDFAWRDGADCLKEACSEECTIDQLKLILSRGERELLRMDDETGTVGWGVFKIENYPNIRVLHVTNLVAHGCHFERFFDSLKTIAEGQGCSRIRCSAKPAQARLYASKLGFTPVYITLEIQV
jgi:hypothetical protein